MQRRHKISAVERLDLIPAQHRAERLFLLDLLGDGAIDPSAAAAADPAALLEVTPQTLSPFVHWRLQQAGPDVPSRLRSLFADSYRENAFRHLRRVADLRRIDGALKAAGIPYLVLKGPVLAATVYPDPATRTMTDLDLLVRDTNLPRAIAAMATVGYEVPLRFAGITMAAGDAPPLFNGQPGSPSLELHAMLDSAPDDAAGLEAAWSTARLVDLRHGLAVPALAQDEFFAHVVTHLSRHHRFEGELRSLLDVALLLRSGETNFDWTSLKPEWDRRGITVWIQLTVSLASILLGAQCKVSFPDAEPSAETLALAAEQLWVDKGKKVSDRITNLFAGSAPAPVHAHAQGETVPMPTGLAGLRLRARRRWEFVHRTFATLANGTLRPRNVAQDVAMLRRRERLFTLVEQNANRPTQPTEPPSR
jgi:hypothetical protein